MTQQDEWAQAVYEKMMEKDYCTQWMQAHPVFIKAGHCKLQMTVRKEMLNGYGILHGGIAFAFADSAFAFASNSYGRLSVSINGSMTYAKSAREGEVLFAEAKALNVGYKTADFDVNVMNESGEIYYFFEGPYIEVVKKYWIDPFHSVGLILKRWNRKNTYARSLYHRRNPNPHRQVYGYAIPYPDR